MNLSFYRGIIKPHTLRTLFLANNKYSTTETSSTESLNVILNKGLYQLTVPLVSRHEKCLFILRPTSDTVGDVMNYIANEDKGIKDVSVLNKDGVLISQSDLLDTLMRENFVIKLNDKVYNVHVPKSNNFEESREKEKLDDVMSLVSDLHRSINQDVFFSLTEKRLQEKLEDLQSQLLPLEKKREELSALSAARNKRIAWLALGGMGLQFGLLGRLTWWEYSWDVMEPVTYFLGVSYVIAMLGYYVVTKQEYNYESAFNRLYLLNIAQNSHKKKFDIELYNQLKDEVATVEEDLRRLRDTTKLSVPLQPRLSDIHN